MSEEKRGTLSLRKKKSSKPKISAPTQIAANGPPKTNNDAAAFPGHLEDIPDMPALSRTETSQSSLRGRPSINGADRTADLVKRRYSTRFVGQPYDAGPVPTMPAMPNIPLRFQQQQTSVSPSREGRSPERPGQGLRVDPRALRDPHLQPEQCMLYDRMNMCAS